MHFGGRPFTAKAIRDNVKVSDGQQWIACDLTAMNLLLIIIKHDELTQSLQSMNLFVVWASGSDDDVSQ